MPFGYHGRYLRIDVSRGAVERVPLADDLLRQYIGGSGLGARVLLDEGGATADPLSPDAPLVFAFSPLVGSPLTTSAKFAVVSRSPLTDRFNDSLASSGFALAGKRAGGDALVIVGRAPALSVLVIDDGEVRLEPAEDLRGAACPRGGRDAARAARRGLPHRLDRSGGRAGGALRDDFARRPARRARRQRRGARQQEHQGDRRAGTSALRVGASAGASSR